MPEHRSVRRLGPSWAEPDEDGPGCTRSSGPGRRAASHSRPPPGQAGPRLVGRSRLSTAICRRGPHGSIQHPVGRLSFSGICLPTGPHRSGRLYRISLNDPRVAPRREALHSRAEVDKQAGPVHGYGRSAFGVRCDDGPDLVRVGQVVLVKILLLPGDGLADAQSFYGYGVRFDARGGGAPPFRAADASLLVAARQIREHPSPRLRAQVCPVME